MITITLTQTAHSISGADNRVKDEGHLGTNATTSLQLLVPQTSQAGASQQSRCSFPLGTPLLEGADQILQSAPQIFCLCRVFMLGRYTDRQPSARPRPVAAGSAEEAQTFPE